MNLKLIPHLRCLAVLPFFILTAGAQNPSSPAPAQQPVSYASVNQLNGMLSQLEQISQSTLGDLAKMRVDRWKVDSSTKSQGQGNVESIQRNLQGALPALIGELRAAPESLPTTFKLYRNLDALFDVFSSVVESAGAFGSKDDFQSLQNDLESIQKSRHAFADRMQGLAGDKEAELSRLRTQVQMAQAAAAQQPPKKIVVDDNEPVKKPVAKKKAVPKPPTATAPAPK